MSNVYTKKIVNLYATKSVVFDGSALLKKVTVVSLGNSNITVNTVKEISSLAEANTLALKKETETAIKNFFSYNENKPIQILELGAAQETQEGSKIVDKVKKLAELLEQEKLVSYIVLLPIQFNDAANIVDDLLKQYNDVNKMMYFLLSVDKTWNLKTEAKITKFKDLKCVVMCYEILDKDSATATLMSIYVNSLSSITSNNRLSALTYKYIKSNITENILDVTIVNELENLGICYFGNLINKNCLMNVKCMDKEDWTYYIAYDNISIHLQSRLTSVLVNANNIPNSAIQYNDIGIKQLKSVIESELSKSFDKGLLTAFSSGYDIVKEEMTGLNQIKYIPFLDYKKENPTDYMSGKYNGFTFNLMISRFILEVNMYTTLY